MPTQILLLSSRDAAQHLNTPTKGTAWGAQNPCPVLPFGGSPCVRQPTKNLFSHPGYENSQGASQGWLWAEKEHIVTDTQLHQTAFVQQRAGACPGGHVGCQLCIGRPKQGQ